MTLRDADKLISTLEKGRPSYGVQGASRFEDLRLRLLEAAVWCSSHVAIDNVKTCLRPEGLAPTSLPRDRWHTLGDVVSMRRQGLWRSELLAEAVQGGRLLIYYPDADLTDGAAEAESDGFLDMYNAPPWATWVGYFEEPKGDVSYGRYLVAWIPREVEPYATAGIAVNPEACVNWLDRVEVAARPVFDLLMKVE